ncbi:tyrosine-type recombinase/integrase, partial [Pontibacterium sp.]|uniref:tyrosine-type recombinase/integrase n=1 Tax=Pontibacterium sp. TaxID=2036026 RepID=UPI0035674B48
MALTDKQLKALKPRDKKYTVTDQHGLMIEVRPNGGKYWTYRFRLNAKRVDMALGVYPIVTLKDARERRDDARKLVDRDIDPRAARKAERETRRNIAANTFEALAREWYALKHTEWSDSHQQRTIRNLEHDLFPTIGR